MAENERFVPDEQGSVLESKRGCGMTEKYCNRDCIHFESDYHWYGNEEWEEVNCELGYYEIHDTTYFTYCEDYDNGGKYDD